jgi:aspartyl-tRNA(Asn)/glutamyl-tRNA(Gln) amidotransferase subunit C
MVTITRDDIRQLASLSSLHVDEAEADALKDDLQTILSYFELLNELDTDQVEPTYQLNQLSNIWRDDTIDMSGGERESLLALAGTHQRENQIEVPKVL